MANVSGIVAVTVNLARTTPARLRLVPQTKDESMKGEADLLPPALAAALSARAPLLWLNPERSQRTSTTPEDAGIAEAAGRFTRSQHLLVRLFPDRAEGGIIDSPLLRVPRLQQALGIDGLLDGQVFLKADHALPIAGSVKARGGFHEVLAHAEALVLEHRLCEAGADLELLALPKARKLFASRTIAVGSTGNLGLSIGMLASALGFKAVVHMSGDAKAWKKDALRRCSVRVVEHSGDYASAVEAGRHECRADPNAYFVDDENSPLLFMGYAAAARQLAVQLAAAGRTPSAERPLFVYIPCGVGGAPGGIAFGLDRLFGPHVHCFFAEPVGSPCMLVQMAAGTERPVSVYDIGLDNRTEADGLAVPRASMLVASAMKPVLAGVFTVTDEQMFDGVLQAWDTERLKIEPSAAAGFGGPRWIRNNEHGARYVESAGLESSMPASSHVLWTTGGAQLPGEEHRGFVSRARSLSSP